MKETVLKYALKNALDFQGKINFNVVLGLVLKEDPTLKSNVPDVLQKIKETAEEMEKLSVAQIRKKLEKLAPELLQQKKEEKMAGPLKPLPNAQQGKVIVRIAPSPSGPLHIGHAYGVSLNYEYAMMYKGKLLLRIEDTNPENIYPQAYELIERDAQWLTQHHVAQTITQSSRLKMYQNYCRQLIQEGKAYVCTCEAEAWREQKNKGIACACRANSVKENEQRYAKMFKGYAEGEAVVRLKTDIAHKNPAMRDFGIMRIIDHVHPRTGKQERVWPLMVYSVAVDDHELGVTHVLNGKDHTDNALKERMIMDCFSWKYPEYKHWGRINFEGYELSTTKTRKAIEEGKYQGWEDIRLPFLPALRRRGYQPEAFQKFAVETGLSLNDKMVAWEEFWKMINAFNKEIVESKAKRYFFVDNPILFKIKKGIEKKVLLDLHPDHPDWSKRELKAGKEVYIAQSDYSQLANGKIHRLMDAYNFMVIGEKAEFVSEEYEEYKDAKNKGMIIHWLPLEEVITVEVLLEDGSVVKGHGEKGLLHCNAGDIVQLERRYFARVDAVGKNNVVLWYLHT